LLSSSFVHAVVAAIGTSPSVMFLDIVPPVVWLESVLWALPGQHSSATHVVEDEAVC